MPYPGMKWYSTHRASGAWWQYSLLFSLLLWPIPWVTGKLWMRFSRRLCGKRILLTVVPFGCYVLEDSVMSVVDIASLIKFLYLVFVWLFELNIGKGNLHNVSSIQSQKNKTLKLKYLYAICGNGKWYSHYGKHSENTYLKKLHKDLKVMITLLCSLQH